MRFSAAVQLALYRTLELSADGADACVARSVLRTHPGPPFYVRCRGADATGLQRGATLTDTLPYTLFENFLAVPARARITHFALPHFVGVPPAAHVVPPNAAPHLAVLDNNHGLAAALSSSHLLCRLTLRIASTLYDGLRPAALFDALGSTRKELGLRLAPDVDIRTCGGIWARGWKYSSCLRGTSGEVSLLPDVQALRTLRLRATLATEAPKAPRVSRYGHGLRWDRHCVASCFLRGPTGNSSGEWVRVN